MGEVRSLEKVVLEMLIDIDNEELSKISKFTHLSLEKINEIKARFTNNLQLAGD